MLWLPLLYLVFSFYTPGVIGGEMVGSRVGRSTEKLEYVMRVLEEQGLLHAVDEELLKRIQVAIQKRNPKSESNIEVKDVNETPRISVLEKAKLRQQQLFGVRSKTRPPTPRPKSKTSKSRAQYKDLFSGRSQVVGGECQALKTENRILKQQLLAAQSQQQQLQGSKTTRNLLNEIQVMLNM